MQETERQGATHNHLKKNPPSDDPIRRRMSSNRDSGGSNHHFATYSWKMRWDKVASARNHFFPYVHVFVRAYGPLSTPYLHRFSLAMRRPGFQDFARASCRASLSDELHDLEKPQTDYSNALLPHSKFHHRASLNTRRRQQFLRLSDCQTLRFCPRPGGESELGGCNY
eukprot:480717-Hanusia_phi.AAC.3